MTSLEDMAGSSNIITAEISCFKEGTTIWAKVMPVGYITTMLKKRS